MPHDLTPRAPTKSTRYDYDRSWLPPDRKARGGTKMAYLADVISAGEDTVSTKPGYKDIPRAIDLVSGLFNSKATELRSDLVTNRGKRILREVIANITDIRPVEGYSTENPAFADTAEMFNKLWKAIYFKTQFHHTMKRAGQWMAAGGVSYISPVYRNLRLGARMKRGLAWDVYSIADALPFQLPDDNDVQGAFAWTLIRYMPEFEAQSKFPDFADQLRPIARRRYQSDAAKDRISLAERFRAGIDPVAGRWGEMFDEIRFTTLTDLSINESKKPVPMGDPGMSESYVVPYVGMEIPSGEFTRSGTPKTRKAKEEDCYLYPNKRLMVSQSGMREPLYDGPGWFWHGMHPIARFSADEWPWEAGYSLVREIMSVEGVRQRFERGLDQTAKARFDPALIYDKNMMNQGTAREFDPYRERGRLGLDGPATAESVRTALPDKLLDPPGDWMNYLKYLGDLEDYLLGMSALDNMARAKIAAGGDDAEKGADEAGPIVKDISHGMEKPVSELMEMTLYNFLQYLPTGTVMKYVGADGVSMQILDLNPSTLVPSHLPGEDASEPSAFTRMERTKNFLDNISLSITPGSLHGVVQTQQKLLWMQLQRAGFMISSETVAKALDIPNWGTLDGNTEIEKWKSEQRMKVEFATIMQMIQQGLQGPPPAGMAPGSPGAPTPSPLLTNHPHPGRPSSGQKPPELKTKGSAEGPRAVISESG